MSVEMKDCYSNILDIDTVEGVFLNAMLCSIKEVTDRSCWVPDGRLPEALTGSLMRIGNNRIRNLATMITFLERDTAMHQHPDSDERHIPSVKQSELYIAEELWSFIETKSTSSNTFYKGALRILAEVRGHNDIPFVCKDTCTFHDWLLINSILEKSEIDFSSSTTLFSLINSIVECYQKNSNF